MLQEFISLCKLPESIVKEVAFFPYESGILLNCSNAFVAKWLARNRHAIERAMKELGLYRVIITVRGQLYWPISMNQDSALTRKNEVTAMSISRENFLNIDVDALDLSRPDLIMTELQNLKYPTHITLLGIEESPFNNNAEILRMPGVPPSKYLTYSQDLTYFDELSTRNRLLRTDKKLKDYTFKAKRWHQEGELWLKKEILFVIDFSLCEFWNQPARIGIIKSEEDLGKFVD